MGNSKQSSAEMASTASRVMQMAKLGGPIEANRAALRLALRTCDRGTKTVPKPVAEEAENETADMLLAAVERVLKPYFDDSESLAASVVSQGRGKK